MCHSLRGLGLRHKDNEQYVLNLTAYTGYCNNSIMINHIKYCTP